MNHCCKKLSVFLLAAALLFPSCERKSEGESAIDAERNDIISFLTEDPGGRSSDKPGGGKGGEQNPAPAVQSPAPHPLFYLNGVWSAIGAYDDDLYYEYDEIEEMSLVFENGWAALTADGSTTLYPVEREEDMLFITVSGEKELGDARIILDYYDNGYYLGLIPENDPTFELLFERQ